MEEKIKTDKELKKYLKQIANANKKRNVVLRGILNGIFTAFGATIGFALVIFLSSRLISNLRQFSFVDNFLAETKLDVIIESQIREIERESIQADSVQNNSEDDTEDNISNRENYFLGYENQELGIKFSYPASLTQQSQYLIRNDSDTSAASVISFQGFGLITNLEVFVNYQNFELEGESYKFNANNPNREIILQIFEKGAVLNQVVVEDPVFYFSIVEENSRFDFVGIGDKDAPKTSRELFLTIPESFMLQDLE